MDNPTPVLETKRLILRELNQNDFDAACRLLQDPDVMVAYEGPFTCEEVQAWLDKQLNRYSQDGFGLWAVIEKESGSCIGQCGITLQEYEGNLVPEVGYLFCKAYWHHGFATEAARACKEYAFQKWGFSEIYSIIRDTNHSSMKVALRNGMVQVGEQVKHYRGIDIPHKVFKAIIRWTGYRLTQSFPTVTAFSTTRHGGVGSGAYASLNCTPYTGDADECVHRNQELLMQSLPQHPQELVIPWQTHGTDSLIIDDTYLQAPAKERHRMLQGIDSLITREPGVCLCISTADCIPVLLYDKKNHAVAAIHAGWRGTVNRIVLHTFRRMEALYGTRGEDIHAVIAPGISLAAFEVGEEVYEAFRAAGFPMPYIAQWHNDTHKHHLDLPAANVLQLLDLGVPEEQIEQSGLCTYTRHKDFFSARRLGIRSGRMLTGIMLNA